MKYITPIAVISIVLLQFSGAVPKSSVAGAMTIALAYLIAALVVGIYEAWSQRRGVLGWIVSIVTALAGAIVATLFASFVIDEIVPYLNIQGSLAETRHPLLYILSIAMMLMTLLGSWTALLAVNRLR